MKKELETKVFEALGEASGCWENLKGAGVFESTRAKEIGEKLCDYIIANTIPKPKGLKERLIYFFKYTIKGALIYSLWYLFHSFLLWLGFLLVYPLPFLKVFGIFIILRMVKVGIIELKTDKHHPEEK